MYSIMYEIYFTISRSLRKNKSPIKIKILGYIEAYYNIFLIKFFNKGNSKKIGLNKKQRDKRIVASLTSFPDRINTVWITIETIMRQSMKADEIILWLAQDQFSGVDSLPIELLNLQKRGLKIRFCEDLKSHKKYYYAMQQFKDDLIVLFDDDMFYPKDTIKKLYHMHKKNPKDICVITTQKIIYSVFDPPSFWKNPEVKERIHHSNSVQIFTGSGSLFVPGSLDQDVFNKELLSRLCPYADDLWLTFMAFKKGTKITSLTKWRAFPVSIYGTGKNSLWYINSEAGKNDEQWKSLIDYYPEDFKRIEEIYEKNKKFINVL